MSVRTYSELSCTDPVMTSLGVARLRLAISLFSLIIPTMAFSVADHPLQIHLTEWKTLPSGDRVSCNEKMHRHHMETLKRKTAEASTQQWQEKHGAIGIGSRGRKLSNSSRTVIAANTTAEVDALLAFRSAILVDPTEALANWTLDNKATKCSDWKGVTCDEAGHVTQIVLPELGLNGTISPAIGDFAHLSSLNLSWSNFWGSIPSELGQCRNLSVLDLSQNSLGGEVPPELFSLPSLEILWLSTNEISGGLPEVVHTNGCRSLTEFWIDNNTISGALPTNFSRCKNLTFLSFTNNHLNGSIPGALGELHQLKQLWLDTNRFTGRIPSQLGSLTKINYLVLEGNYLGGQIPPFLGTLSDLQYLNLKNNNFTGSIPPSLGNCSSLVYLFLGYNQLTGTIPEELGNLSNIQSFGFEYNWKLTGPVPGFLAKCSKLNQLFIGACAFTSIAPEIWSMKSMQQIALFSNNLTGELPLEVGNSTSLFWLDLGWLPNRLTGSIPPTLGLLSNLSTLSLQMNLLTGGIPTELGNLKQLKTLWLGRNEGLSGTIPREVSNLTTLEDIDLGYCNLSDAIPYDLFTNNLNIKRFLLNNNKLTGILPTSVGKLQFLKTLYLHNNNLSGGIPTELGGCASLTDIVLSSNQFNGTIPASLGKLSNLEATLDLSQNYLTGNLPVSLGNLTKLQRLILSTNALNGTIPDNLGECLSLNLLDLSSNRFTGGIPKFLSNFSDLTSLDLSNNMFNDDAGVLSGLSQCSKLESLMVGQNKIYGSLPVDFTKWPGLKYFSVTGNTLVGGIPPSFGGINSSLVLADFSRNNFTGEFPAQLNGAHLSDLRVLLFSHNEIEGSIPSWFGNLISLQALDLSFNKLTGSIPQSVGNLAGYKVQSNDTSSKPGFTLNQRLNLTYKGDSVAYSYFLQAATFMDMSSNALRGEIPVEITQLVGMKYMTLSNNSFEGNIWTSVQNMNALESLDLSHNNLSGPLPPLLPSSLSAFKVYLNNLSGAIPTGAQYNTFDSSYYLPGNPGLCGAIIQVPCAGDAENSVHSRVTVLDYISFPGFGIGAAAGFCFVAMTALLCDSVRVFVFGAADKRKGSAKIQPAYGLFNPKF